MYRKNVANQSIFFTMVNATTGAADASATVTVKYTIDNGGTQQSSGGSTTNLGNGQYRYVPTQAETNGNQIGFLFTATSDVPVSVTIITTTADPTDSVRFGLTALPNAAAEASGGLITRGTSTGQITLSSGTVTTGTISNDAISAAALATDAVTEIVTALLTTQMTEAYATDGSAPTLAQGIHMLIARLFEESVAGTTMTCKKLDGSTTAMTFTLNDAVSPTSLTRAS